MATNLWGVTTVGDETIKAQLNDPSPVIADNGGTEVGIAYLRNGQIYVDFLDEQGLPSAARPSTLVSAIPAGAAVSNIAISSTGLGYAVSWTQTVEGVTTTWVRYIGLTGAYDVPVQIATGAVSNVALGGYALDGTDGKKMILDGFDAAWIDSEGHVQFQRYAVWLDSKKDPIGVVQAAGLDGVPPPNITAGNAALQPPDTDGNSPTQLSANIGSTRAHDVSVTTTHDGEAVVTWIETNPTNEDGDSVHVAFVDATGSRILTAADIDLGVPNAAGSISSVHVMQMAGGFVVAWATEDAIVGKVYTLTPGATPGVGATFAAGPLKHFVNFTDLPGAGYAGEFSIGAMLDAIGGFTISLTSDGAIYARSFDSAGSSLDVALDGVTPLPLLQISSFGNNTHISSAALSGDRVIVASQSGNSSVTARIIDPRTLPDSSSITEGGTGLVILGDGIPAGTPKVLPDVLVGTIGNDLIDGLQGDDVLDGGMGDDRILAGAGSDVIDGGGNVSNTGDVLVLNGTRDDYTITYLGGTLFQVVDNRFGSPTDTGTDLVRNIETFEFLAAGGGSVQVAASEFSGTMANVTPTGWGLADEDPDLEPSAARQPDTDGWIVNTGTDRPGQQSAPVISDSVGEFVSILWETHGSGMSHIRASFLDVLGAPDLTTPLPDNVAVTDGIGYEFAPVVASGGANSGWGLAFSETLNGTSAGVANLKTNFFSLNLTGVEAFIDPNASANQHDAAIYGSFLDRKLNAVTGVVDGPDLILPAGMNDGYNLIYVETPVDALGPYGKIQLQRFEVPLDSLGNPGAALAGGIDGLAGVGADGVTTLSESGRNPTITALHTFETFAAWIQQDNNGNEHVVGTAIDDIGNFIATDLSNISGNDRIAANSNVLIASAGAVNVAVVWIEDVQNGLVHDHYQLKATMYSSPGNGLNGQDFGFVAPSAPFSVMTLPDDIDLASITITGISGEDSNDFIVQWDAPDSSGTGHNIVAQHISVVLDPIAGVALAMNPNGAAVQVNAISAGNQIQNGVTGLLSDRFISVWMDDHTDTGGNSDIVARIMDTREVHAPTGDEITPDIQDRLDAGETVLIGQHIIGDFVRPNGAVQPRRDIIVGTIGDDVIQGDISDADGLVDAIYGGLGNDIIRGGPGIRGAAGIPEVIDGGEGRDTSVYTGNLSDYIITAIFDPASGGGWEIVDKRPVANAAGDPLQNDGVDNVFGIEFLQFRDITLDLASDVFTPVKPDLLASFNGTPTNWSLSTPISPVQMLKASVPEQNALLASRQSQIAVTNLQDDAAMAWVQGTSKVYGIRYDITGAPDPLWTTPAMTEAGPIEMTDGTFAGNTVSNPAIAMAGGLGFVGAWESTGNTGTDIHLRFGSTATTGASVFDPAAGYPGYGWAGGEIVIPNSLGGSKPVVMGYEIVNGANDTLEYGFHVAFVKNNVIQLARYEIPVYNVDPTSGTITGVPTPDAFGRGAETQPQLIGANGLRGDADDSSLIAVGNGREPTLATLHDGELVVGYIDGSGQVQLVIYEPTVDQTSDRDPTADTVPGITTYGVGQSYTMGTAGGAVKHAQVVAQQNGSFGVFWTETDAADSSGKTLLIKANIFEAGTQGSEQTLETISLGSAANAANIIIKAMPAGVNSVGQEAGFVVTWLDETQHIQGKNFNMAGEAVGDQFQVDRGVTHTSLTAAGIDNGLLIVGYESAINGGDVQVSYLDTRQAGDVMIGPRTGAPRDVAVGTTGDDAMDGRNLADQLFGGLGDDVITLGAGADLGDGGDGSDVILGGAGQDQILGGAGNDLLLAGPGGPADAKVDRDLQTGLQAAATPANVTAAQWTALIASENGADIVAGGNGIDTISYSKDFGSYRIDLAAGLVLKQVDPSLPGSVSFTDNGVARSYLLEAVNGAIGDDGAGGTAFQFNLDLENAEGGQRDDVLLGDAGNNVLIGGGGDDFIDGRGGSDTAVFRLASSQYTVSKSGATTTVIHGAETTRLQGVEFLQFADKRISFSDPDLGLIAKLASDQALDNVNTSPTAVADNLTIARNHVGVIKVLANDSDLDGGQIVAITNIIATINGNLVTIPIAAGGAPVAVGNGSGIDTIALGNNGQLIVTPTAGFTGTTSFQYTIADGNGGTSIATVTVSILDPSAPVLAGGPGTVTYTENSAPVIIAPALSISDVDSTQISGATITIVNYAAANAAQPQDALAIAPALLPPGITVASNAGGVLSLTGTASLAAYQAALEAVTYVNTSERPNVAQRTINFQVIDVDGHTSNVEAVGVNVIGVNDAPVGTVIISNATDNGAGTATLSATNTIVDVDLAGPPVVSYQWQSSTSLTGTYTNVTGATTATLSLAAAPGSPTWYRVQGSYSDPFGTTTLTSTDRVLIGTASANTASSFSTNGVKAVLGMGGDDQIIYVAGSASGLIIDGGSGLDTVLVQTSFGPVSDSQLRNVERVSANGLNAGVTIDLSAQTEGFTFGGGIGILGGSGNDTITGSQGVDTINGQAGNDTYRGIQAGDTINDGGGTDTIVLTNANASALNAMSNAQLSGVDIVDASATTAGVTISVGNQTEAFTLTGGSGADTISGGSNGDILVGGAGNDSLIGNGGNDTARFTGTLTTGNALNYTIDINAGNQIVATDLTAGRDGTDTLSSIEGLQFGATTYSTSTSTLFVGTSGGNTLNGAGTADLLIGGGGADTLSGNGNSDILFGGTGNDRLTGGGGKDFLFGGGGDDTFIFNATSDSATTAPDIIRDFEGAGLATGDLIDVSVIDANTTLGADQAFSGTLLGAGVTFNAAGQIRLSYDATNNETVLQFNTDNNFNTAEMEVHLAGNHQLTRSDFIL